MADKSNDPVAMWQNMIGEMEKGFNSFANQAMSSPEFSKVMNQVGGVTAGAQKQLGELMEKYLVSMNLPSRAQMVGMAERLQSIEGQLNEIKAMIHQVSHASGAPAERLRHADAAAHQTAALGRGRAEMNAPHGSRSRFDPGSDPDRGAARDPAQHQGRRIFLVFRADARLDAEGRARKPRHHAALSLPAAGG